jgi:hypothetical protein
MESRDFYLGLDISTTNIGLALFNDKGALVELKHLKLHTDVKTTPDTDRYLIKGDQFYKFLISYRDHVKTTYEADIKTIFVEEPLMMSNNQFTSALLQKFNGVCCYIIKIIFGICPEMISVHEARSLFCPEFVKTKTVKGKLTKTLSFPKEIDKKEYIWKKVASMERDIQWIFNKKGDIAQENYDMSDAYCVGVAKLREKKIL